MIRMCVRGIEEGDQILFNERSRPLIAKTDAQKVDEYVGAIFVLWRVPLKGPCGADATLEYTGTGRIRCSPGRYAPHENVHRLEKVS